MWIWIPLEYLPPASVPAVVLSINVVDLVASDSEGQPFPTIVVVLENFAVINAKVVAISFRVICSKCVGKQVALRKNF